MGCSVDVDQGQPDVVRATLRGPKKRSRAEPAPTVVARCTRASAFTGYLRLVRAGEPLRGTSAYQSPRYAGIGAGCGFFNASMASVMPPSVNGNMRSAKARWMCWMVGV